MQLFIKWYIAQDNTKFLNGYNYIIPSIHQLFIIFKNGKFALPFFFVKRKIRFSYKIFFVVVCLYSKSPFFNQIHSTQVGYTEKHIRIISE